MRTLSHYIGMDAHRLAFTENSHRLFGLKIAPPKELAPLFNGDPVPPKKYPMLCPITAATGLAAASLLLKNPDIDLDRTPNVDRDSLLHAAWRRLPGRYFADEPLLTKTLAKELSSRGRRRFLYYPEYRFQNLAFAKELFLQCFTVWAPAYLRALNEPVPETREAFLACFEEWLTDENFSSRIDQALTKPFG